MTPTGIVMRATRQLRGAHPYKRPVPPAMKVMNRPGPPAVNYLCPLDDRPIGGIRAIYRHVDMLNDAGINASVVHPVQGFSCSWFKHETRIAAARSVALSQQDVLVVPEWYGPGFASLPIGPRIVVFNQNAYKTFTGLDDSAPAGAPYREVPRLEAILAVSSDNADYLRYAFPEFKVAQVRNAVDSAVFNARGKPVSRRIAFMPRKRGDDARQVLRLLGARGSLNGWEVVPIENRSESETADLLHSCAIFLSFSSQEGFGLPPAEAMASGCYVIGFHGLGGREYFRPEFSQPVEEGNVLAFALAAASALAEDPVGLAERGGQAASYILSNYGLQQQREDLLTFFSELLKV